VHATGKHPTAPIFGIFKPTVILGVLYPGQFAEISRVGTELRKNYGRTFRLRTQVRSEFETKNWRTLADSSGLYRPEAAHCPVPLLLIQSPVSAI
jgi:hypothetical protein